MRETTQGRRVAGLVTGLLLWAAMMHVGNGAARTGDLTRDPSDLVKTYVSLDSKGVRLDSMSSEALWPYVNWKEEPAFGHLVIIDGYEVVDDLKQWKVISNVEVLIPVRYRVLGSIYWGTASFLSEQQVEEVAFRVKAINSRWKIVEPMLPPHVTQRRTVNFVREAALDEQDAAQRRLLDQLQEELRKAKWKEHRDGG